MGMRDEMLGLARRARQARPGLATLSRSVKDKALIAMADALVAGRGVLLAANKRDLDAARGLSSAMVDRLTLTDARIESMAEGLRQVAVLPDPVGEMERVWVRPNGLRIGKMRVPIGVVLVIYESRPNVTADAAGLCLKSGNPCILRGGSESIHTNSAIAGVLTRAAAAAGVPEGAIQFVETTDREAVGALVELEDCIDVVIPRGGKGLVKAIAERSRIPVIKHLDGVCHTFVDASADREMALAICHNAKVQRPGVCNAMETLLVHAEIAESFLPAVAADLEAAGVELRGCERSREIVSSMKAATEDDWYAEYLDLILAVRVVDGLEEAIDHINRYGSAHSDAIVTEDYSAAMRFLEGVDSAVVYVNASTRFTDGFEFGFGAEIGISTNRLHARGPMGLFELTTYKYVVFGSGQVRG